MIIKLHLNFKNYGVYAATFSICNNLYVRQTMNSFNKKQNANRSIWKHIITKLNREINHQFALIILKKTAQEKYTRTD